MLKERGLVSQAKQRKVTGLKETRAGQSAKQAQAANMIGHNFRKAGIKLFTWDN